jgi:hypothetical protein
VLEIKLSPARDFLAGSAVDRLPLRRRSVNKNRLPFGIVLQRNTGEFTKKAIDD